MNNLKGLILVIVLAVSVYFASQFIRQPQTQFPSGPPQTGITPGSGVVEIVEQVRPSVVTVALTAIVPDIRRGSREVEGNIGSGFVLTQDGYIVTNKHVVSVPNSSYSVVMNETDEYRVQQIFTDPVHDIAIIKIDASNLRPLTIGDSSRVRLGENVIAIGTTLGEFTNSVTTGVVSGLDRDITAQAFDGSIEQLDDLIQTDAAINPGNSGGPLLNSLGQVVGINTAIVGGAQNVGFAVPANNLRNFAFTQLISI
jgi:serine protease Do